MIVSSREDKGRKQAVWKPRHSLSENFIYNRQNPATMTTAKELDALRGRRKIAKRYSTHRQ
jgi:hypothetical protein